ncbi:MAG: hypothetical protein AB1630_11910, partial [bacterium]
YLKNPEQAFLAGLNLGKKYDLGHLSSLTNKAGSLYNSLIENKYYKFGTALTGQDVWGNKLTWEERLAGLKSYQRNSDWNNKFGDVIEGIIWKKNITLPKIDLPKIGLPNIDLGDIDFKTMGLDGIANYAINLGAKTPGGIGGVLDKLWDSLKDIFEKEGITKEDLKNKVNEGMQKKIDEANIEKKIKEIIKDGTISDKEKTDLELLLSKYLQAYNPFGFKIPKEDWKELGIRLSKDIANVVVGYIAKSTGVEWELKAIKITKKVFEGDFKGTLESLIKTFDSTGMFKLAKMIADYAKYPADWVLEYTYKKLSVNFSAIGEGTRYRDAISAFRLENGNVFPDLAGIELIILDVAYYDRTKTHLPGFVDYLNKNFPEASKRIIDFIANPSV